MENRSGAGGDSQGGREMDLAEHVRFNFNSLTDIVKCCSDLVYCGSFRLMLLMPCLIIVDNCLAACVVLPQDHPYLSSKGEE